MTVKQCNPCKYHICVKELGDKCFLIGTEKSFMRNKNCNWYKFGRINEEHKSFFKKFGKKYPFTEIKEL